MVPGGKGWDRMVVPVVGLVGLRLGGTVRGRPREEVEWMRRVSEITLWRLGAGMG